MVAIKVMSNEMQAALNAAKTSCQDMPTIHAAKTTIKVGNMPAIINRVRFARLMRRFKLRSYIW